MKEFETYVEELAWFIGLVEGEGSFNVSSGRGRLGLKMSDLDVIERAKTFLQWWGIDLKISQPKIDGRWKAAKQLYEIQTSKASYLKTIIAETYEFFSEKKQGDCRKVLDNLADRGLL